MVLLYSYFLLFFLEFFDFDLYVIDVLVNYFCGGGYFDVVFGVALEAHKVCDVFDKVADVAF